MDFGSTVPSPVVIMVTVGERYFAFDSWDQMNRLLLKIGSVRAWKSRWKSANVDTRSHVQLKTLCGKLVNGQR